MVSLEERLGAEYLANGSCRFLVWAPFAEKIEAHISFPEEKFITLKKDAKGYHRATIDGLKPGSLYRYRINDNKEYPDPASRYQLEGVHGRSQIADTVFAWEDGDWSGLPLKQYIVYELHVGAFTKEGTFEAIINHLDKLKGLGITAIEFMPVAQFPGERNWGYDGVYPFAVHNSYGGPDGLKRLINACHRKKLAVILDVVYNHLGPEGNYFGEFGPYFTDRYRTPWGQAINFDGPYNDEVRRYFIENTLYWIKDFHIDALRLDALHAIFDCSPRTFLEELADSLSQPREELGRQVYLIGESDANDRRLIRSQELGGYGLDAQWNDDFHHALHVILTNERSGYYQDFGRLQDLVKAFREGFVYSGDYSPYRRRRHGSSSRDIPAQRFLVFAQNHDQVGNRMLGERLSQLVSFEELKLAAGVVLLSPFIPLLFMGEEYGETAPFQYFTSHSDPALIEAVRIGRRQEFANFQWQGQIPDPQDQNTFSRAKLHFYDQGNYIVLFEFYKHLIRLRKETPALSRLSKDTLEIQANENNKQLYMRRWNKSSEVIAVFNFGNRSSSFSFPFPVGHWCKLIDSADTKWLGCGSSTIEEFNSEGEITLGLEPKSFSLFNKVEA